MSTFALWRLFHRGSFTTITNSYTNTTHTSTTATDTADANTDTDDIITRRTSHPPVSDYTGILAIIAFAAATTIFLTVLGGVHGFIWRASADHTLGCFINPVDRCNPAAVAALPPADSPAGQLHAMSSTYVILAIFACLLLIVPFATLTGSAARLAASRRDERLAALRLAGATTSQVTRLTAFDSTLQAVTGALLGIIGYFAVMPLIMLLNFQNQHFTFEQLWVGPIALILTVVGVAILALISALITLRRVAITPLGVSNRQSQPLPSGRRFVIFAVVFVLGFIVLSNMQVFNNAGTVVVFAVTFGIITGIFALLNLIGSFIVTLRARSRVRHPRQAATLIAMRRILGNPKRAWRNVSGIALAVFIAGITSVCAMFATLSGSDPNEPGAIMMRDIGTGGLLTLIFAGILAAVSSGIMQSASVYDQADEYRMLILEGTDRATLRRARFQEVLTPLNTVVVISGAISMLLMLPLVGNLITNSMTLLSFFGGIVFCYALVLIGALTANHTADRICNATKRADD